MAKLKITITDNDLKRWKQRYNCSLGENSGWCDGTGARRCPQALLCSHKAKDGAGCFLKV